MSLDKAAVDAPFSELRRIFSGASRVAEVAQVLPCEAAVVDARVQQCAGAGVAVAVARRCEAGAAEAEAVDQPSAAEAVVAVVNPHAGAAEVAVAVAAATSAACNECDSNDRVSLEGATPGFFALASTPLLRVVRIRPPAYNRPLQFCPLACVKEDPIDEHGCRASALSE